MSPPNYILKPCARLCHFRWAADPLKELHTLKALIRGPLSSSKDCLARSPGETCTLQCIDGYAGEAAVYTCLDSHLVVMARPLQAVVMIPTNLVILGDTKPSSWV